MINFKDYLWKRFKTSMLLYWIILVFISGITYAGVIVILKKHQLSSSLEVAADTVHEAMEAGEWPIALSHLTRLEEKGLLFNIQLSDTQAKQGDLIGPFGQKPFGFGKICQSQFVVENVNLQGCMVVVGKNEVVTLLSFVFLVLFSFLIVFRLFHNKTYYFVEKISCELKSIASGQNIFPENKEEISEVNAIRVYILSLLNETKEIGKAMAFSQLSLQVVHDIRSPLAVLDIVTKDLMDIKVEKREIIKSAIQQINDIANNMLSQHVKKTINKEISYENNSSSENISKLLTTIVAEKKIQYPNNPIDFQIIIDERSLEKFSLINASNFSRMMSNLINNAVESIQSEGQIKIFLSSETEWLKIDIQDNGCGMTPDMLSAVTQSKGATFKPNGHGLGISHAIQCIKSWNGEYRIESKLGEGTSFKIYFPIAERCQR